MTPARPALRPPHRRALCRLVGLLLVAAGTGLGGAEAAPEPGAGAPPRARSILVVDLEGEVDPVMQAYLVRRLERARAERRDAVVLRIDSYGGNLGASKEMSDALLAMPPEIHVVAWVPNKAISAAAFIALSCDELQMAPDATLGDCQPILMAPGAGGYEEAGEKIESPLRAWFRRCAEANGYPVLLAEAMVSKHLEVVRVRHVGDGRTYFVKGRDLEGAADDDILLPQEVPGAPRAEFVRVGGPVVRKGELLTITAREAFDLGFIRPRGAGLLADEDALLAALKAPDAAVAYTQPTVSERAGRWLYGLTGVLSALVALAIMLFLWQGPGLMTIVGGVALGLVLLISATADHLHGLPLFLMGLGVLLLLAEAFLLPGFGVAGFLGLASLAGGLLFLATGASPADPTPVEAGALVRFGLQFVGTVLGGFLLLALLSRHLPRFGPARALILTAPGAPPPTPVRGAAPPAPGARGRALSPLRPAGLADFGSGPEDVVSQGEWIDAGAPVEVVAVEGTRVTVRGVGTEARA